MDKCYIWKIFCVREKSIRFELVYCALNNDNNNDNNIDNNNLPVTRKGFSEKNNNCVYK